MDAPIRRSSKGSDPGAPPPPTFDPACLFPIPGQQSTWLAANLPNSLAKTPIDKWLKSLELSGPERSTLNTDLEKVNNWWGQQNETALAQLQKVAVMTGIPAPMITANVNADSLLEILTAAITMTC